MAAEHRVIKAAAICQKHSELKHGTCF